MNLQQQRPVRPNYSFAAFQMPRPLQSANEMAVRQTPNPLLQSQFARFPSSVSNLAMNYAIRHRPPALSDTLRRQTVVQQSRQYEMEKGYGSLIPNRQMDPVSEVFVETKNSFVFRDVFVQIGESSTEVKFWSRRTVSV